MNPRITNDLTELRWIHIAPAMLALLVFTGAPSCTEHSEDDGHVHGQAVAEDEHEHDESGSAEHTDEHEDVHGDELAANAAAEHADEVTLTPQAIERYAVKIEEARVLVLEPTFIAPARVGVIADVIGSGEQQALVARLVPGASFMSFPIIATILTPF